MWRVAQMLFSRLAARCCEPISELFPGIGCRCRKFVQKLFWGLVGRKYEFSPRFA